MTDKSRTPRTDKVAERRTVIKDSGRTVTADYIVNADFARTLELEAADLRERLAKAEKNAEKRPDTVHEFLADESGVVDLLPSGDVVPMGSLLQRIMSRLTDMLDDDKFNEIDGMVRDAGYAPPILAAAKAAPSTLTQQPADGVVVPREPTYAMLCALSGEWHSDKFGNARERYAALLAAAKEQK